MLLSEIKKAIEAEVFTNTGINDDMDIDVRSACGSDLMSDVLAYVKDQSLLLTGLINPQVVRTAEMMDIIAICFVRGKLPPQSVIDLADELGIILLGTKLPMYVACGKLYQKDLEGGKNAQAL